MGKSKTEKLVTRILKDENKRRLYSSAELAYFDMQLLSMKVARQKKKLQRKAQKGFTPTTKETRENEEPTE